jgi:hypothetical protein
MTASAGFHGDAELLMSRLCSAIILFFVFPLSVIPEQTAQSETNANELASRVLMNEAKAEAEDHSHWMLQLETEKSGRKEINEVVETKDGDLKWPLLTDGRQLTGAQQKAAKRAIQRFVRDPNALRRSMRGENDDAARSQRMLKVLPKALTFSFGEQRGDTIELHFKPNPQFHAATREESVFQALEGDIWVNRKQARLTEITGHLSHEVKFAGGLLGHLDSGGRFEVQQAEVAPGYWELTRLNVEMKGKALFFKTISVQQKMRRSDFHRVSDDITLTQAADLLRKQAALGRRASSETKPVQPLKQY